MDNVFCICFRTLLVLAILFFVTKLLGKKQVSQLNLFDYVFGITIGSIAADISLDLEKDLISGIVSLLLYGIIAYIIAKATMKSITLRRFITGVPTILMENGKIIESGLKKSKLDINDFLAEARTQGYFDLNEIDTAIMEINGSISFLLKEKDKPSNKSDVNAKLSNSGIPANVIIDSNYMENNMEAMGKGKKWLDHELKVLGYKNYDNILLATCDNNGKIIVYRKNVKPDKNTILELLNNSLEEIDFSEEFYIEACTKCLTGIKEKAKFFPFLEYHFYIYTKDGKYVISTIDKDYEGKSFNKLSRANLVDNSYIVSIIICKHCNDYIIQIENCEV